MVLKFFKKIINHDHFKANLILAGIQIFLLLLLCFFVYETSKSTKFLEIKQNQEVNK